MTLSRNFVNTAAKNPSFVTPEGSTLTLTGTMSGSTTGVFVKQGVYRRYGEQFLSPSQLDEIHLTV